MSGKILVRKTWELTFYLSIFSNPSARAGYDMKSIF